MNIPVNLDFFRAYPVMTLPKVSPEVVPPPVKKVQTFQPQTLLTKSLLLLTGEEFLEAYSELSFPELDWEIWSKLSQRHFNVPIEYFNLATDEVCHKLNYKKRKISGKQRYLEIASLFDLILQDRLGGSELFEPSSALTEALERNDVEAVEYFFSKLPQEAASVFKEKVLRGEYEPEEQFQSLAYQKLVSLLFGRTEQVLSPSEAELAVEKGNLEFFSSLLNSKKVSRYILELVSRGNSEAFLLLEKGLKHSTEEEQLKAVLRSGNQIFLERFLVARYSSNAHQLIEKIRNISVPFEPSFNYKNYKKRTKNDLDSPIQDFGQSLVIEAAESSNPVFIEFLSQHGGWTNISLITSKYYTEPDSEEDHDSNDLIVEIFEKFFSRKTQSQLNPVGMYQIAQRLNFGAIGIFNDELSFFRSVRNDIDLLIYIYHQIHVGYQKQFVEEILFEGNERIQNLEIYRYFLRLKPSVIYSDKCNQFLKNNLALIPSTRKLILEFRNRVKVFLNS